jgi:type IV fimbrial biogenesis protein FimT
MDPRHAANPRNAREAGFSLIEAMVVLAAMAIVATTATPSLVALIDGRRLDAAATSLAADLQFVRTEAVARNRPIRLSVHTSGSESCWIVHTGLAAQCSCQPAPPAVCAAGAAEIKTVRFDRLDRVSVQANVASILFDPLHGTSTPTGTLRLVDPRGRAVHHVVNVMGRVRTCSPGGAVPGWRAC